VSIILLPMLLVIGAGTWWLEVRGWGLGLEGLEGGQASVFFCVKPWQDEAAIVKFPKNS